MYQLAASSASNGSLAMLVQTLNHSIDGMHLLNGNELNGTDVMTAEVEVSTPQMTTTRTSTRSRRSRTTAVTTTAATTTAPTTAALLLSPPSLKLDRLLSNDSNSTAPSIDSDGSIDDLLNWQELNGEGVDWGWGNQC